MDFSFKTSNDNVFVLIFADGRAFHIPALDPRAQQRLTTLTTNLPTHVPTLGSLGVPLQPVISNGHDPSMRFSIGL